MSSPEVYREVSYEYLMRHVRRYKPSSLLPRLAALAALHTSHESWIENRAGFFITPWAIAKLAELSLILGKEHRLDAELKDLRECCEAYLDVTDPDLGPASGLEGVQRSMIRMCFEQLPYRLDPFRELARSVALFEQTECDHELQLMRPGWSDELLGCQVREYVGTALLLWAAARANAGIFNFDWMLQDNFQPVADGIPNATIRRIVNEQFVTTRSDMISRQRALPAGLHRDLRRFNFNPLESRPVIDGVAGPLVVPVPGLLVRKVSPAGIYYSAMDNPSFKTKFSTDLGYVFEAYVGRQLGLLSDAAVHGEISYGRGKGDKSVDWIVEFEDLTLLVEAKSRRPTEPVRLATPKAVQALNNLLKEGFRQIDKTARLIQEQHPGFTHLPKDRPILGLIVTAEPFYMATGPDYRQFLPNSVIPVELCSAYDLERLVAVEEDTLGNLYAEVMHGTDVRELGFYQAMRRSGRSFGRNKILQDAWRTMPWIDQRNQPTDD